jgi:hypothetical protein
VAGSVNVALTGSVLCKLSFLLFGAFSCLAADQRAVWLRPTWASALGQIGSAEEITVNCCLVCVHMVREHKLGTNIQPVIEHYGVLKECAGHMLSLVKIQGCSAVMQ